MDFRILGPLQVCDGGRDRTPGVPKHRELLAILILNSRRPMTVAELRRLLWPGETGERSDSLIRGYVGALRKLLGREMIATRSGTYTLMADDEQIDLARFRRLVTAGGPQEVAQALALWRGPVLADVDPEAVRWQETGRLRAELAELRLLALDARIGHDLDAGRHQQVLAELQDLVARHPARQRLRGHYMLAMYRSGRRVDALATYTELRRELDDGHAIEPDPALQLLYHRMLHDDVALHLSAGPPMLLPHDIPAFTGRRDLIDRVIGDQVIVHGPAGVGKSALAVHAAWRHRQRFPDGVLYADLRQTPSPAAVAEDFLRWLGCPAQAIPPDLDARSRLLRTYSANRHLLMLLDNATAEGEVRPLLTSCPTVITSRSALAGLTAATRLLVGPLDAATATELLTTLIGPDRGGVAELVEICAGLPAALRIAGARLGARPDWPVGYLAGLLRDEGSRLDRIQAGDQTLRGVFRLGYDGLPEAARRTLRGLGALSAPSVAGWVTTRLSRRAAGEEAVPDRAMPGHGEAIEDGDPEAETLVEAGLLEHHVIDVAGQARYRMHPLTRLFARELLGEGVCDVLADLARVTAARITASRFALVSGVPGTVPATIDIRESIEWLLAEREFLVALVTDLHGSGLDEECRRLAHLLAPFLGRHRFLADWRHVTDLALEAARRSGGPRDEALILRDQGDLLHAEYRYAEAHDQLRLALAAFLRAGDHRNAARTRRRLGQVHLALGRLDQAERTLTGCLPATAIGDTRETAETLHALGTTLIRAGRTQQGIERLDEAARLFAALGDRHRHCDVLLETAAAHLASGDTTAARTAAQQARAIATALGDPLLGAYALLTLARLALIEDHPHATSRARDLAAEALTTFTRTGDDHGRDQALALL
ncbi:BTAD domain-containing putative transcriptional regulator [Spongiactinospora sp. 9N601]|uniref:AfsR/SARP family transcriptional regulator n=1 Tax=Spongiactinospora sp. 9N601 TaxID=3375149 RepID=UPI00379F0773